MRTMKDIKREMEQLVEEAFALGSEEGVRDRLLQMMNATGAAPKRKPAATRPGKKSHGAQTVKILAYIKKYPGKTGVEIIRGTGLKSKTVWGALARMKSKKQNKIENRNSRYYAR